MTAPDVPAVARIKTVHPGIFTAGNRFVNVDVDSVEFPDGAHGTYAKVTPAARVGAVGIVRRLVRGIPHVALVRQHRYPIDEVTWEFPRGSHNGDTLETIRTEFVEELGFAPGNITKLGTIRPDTGLLTTRVDAFHAVAVGDVPASYEESATGLQTRWVSQPELTAMIVNGEVTCGITLAAWALLTVSHVYVMPHAWDA